MASVLVIAPHPDDEILGVGGTIGRHVAQGDTVFVGVITRGNPKFFSEESILRVQQEARTAHKLLGVTDTFFVDHLPAPGLDTVPQYEVTIVISDWIKQCNPEIMYIPHRGDIHLDHRIVFLSALVAARPGFTTVTCIRAYETLSETEWAGPSPEDAFRPNLFIDISEHLDQKIAAMHEFTSQLKPFPHPRSVQGIRGLAQYRGAAMQLEAAEAFEVIRDIIGKQA